MSCRPLVVGHPFQRSAVVPVRADRADVCRRNPETLRDPWRFPPFRLSAGPDVREIVMGSEGRFGISEVKVRVTPSRKWKTSMWRLLELGNIHWWPPGGTTGHRVRTAVVQPDRDPNQSGFGGQTQNHRLDEEIFVAARCARVHVDGHFGLTGSRSIVTVPCFSWSLVRRADCGQHRQRWAICGPKSFSIAVFATRRMGYAVDTLETAVDWDKLPRRWTPSKVRFSMPFRGSRCMSLATCRTFMRRAHPSTPRTFSPMPTPTRRPINTGV